MTTSINCRCIECGGINGKHERYFVKTGQPYEDQVEGFFQPCSLSKIPPVLTEIKQEVERAKKHGEKFVSLHEAYGVILEELDEVWDITRQKRRDRDPRALREEFIQLAAMAVKAIESLDNFIGGEV